MCLQTSLGSYQSLKANGMTIRRVKRFLWSQMYLNGDFSNFIPIFKVFEWFISKNNVKSEVFENRLRLLPVPKFFLRTLLPYHLCLQVSLGTYQSRKITGMVIRRVKRFLWSQMH